MRIVGFLLRIFGFLFHFLLGLFLLGIAVVATSSHEPLRLDMLPFSQEHIRSGAYLLALMALLSSLLALTRTFRFVFTLWAAAALFLMVRGFFFSSYTFAGADAFKSALWLIAGALLALIGALWMLKPRRGRL